jgi:hypothetical protein
MLMLDTARSNVEVLVSNSPTFEGAEWIRNPGELPWDLGLKRQTDGSAERKTVYVKFRDEPGNESETYHDSILLVPDGDLDGDGTPDEKDNCLETPNPRQEDRDRDGVGDACDNCLEVFNPDQRDSNYDGTGDACTCEADLNDDGVVDEKDLKRFVNDLGKINCPGCPGDLDEDQDSDGTDISMFGRELGKTGCQ